MHDGSSFGAGLEATHLRARGLLILRNIRGGWGAELSCDLAFDPGV